MTFQSFFKPTYKKVLLAILIFSFLPFITIRPPVFDAPPHIIPISLITAIIEKFQYFELTVIPILGLILSYYLSSTIIHKLNNLSPNFKNEIKQMLKFSKIKIIIASIGWITISIIFVHNLSILYGGYSNVPEGLRSLYSFVDNKLFWTLLPFSIITLALLKINIILNMVFVFLTSLPVAFTDSGISINDLNTFGFYSVSFLIILEWYIISSFSVHIYYKIKNKFV